MYTTNHKAHMWLDYTSLVGWVGGFKKNALVLKEERNIILTNGENLVTDTFGKFIDPLDLVL